jgi:hypothetical protein
MHEAMLQNDSGIMKMYFVKNKVVINLLRVSYNVALITSVIYMECMY